MRPHGGWRRWDIGALSAALTIGLATPAVAAPPTFSGPTPFDAGTSPTALTAADLNADGRPDLAMVDQSAGGTGGNTVLMNATAAGAGTPSFTGPVFYGAFEIPISITAADVDGDARPDLITSDIFVGGVGGVAVLRTATTAGAATAAFTGPTPFDGGEAPRWVAGADLNADGKPDIVVANTMGAEPISVLLNTTTTSTPAFSGPTTFEAGADPRVAVATDVNLDGRPDVAVANAGSAGPDGVSVLLNTTAPGAGRRPSTARRSSTPSLMRWPPRTSTATASPTWSPPTAAPTPRASSSTRRGPAPGTPASPTRSALPRAPSRAR